MANATFFSNHGAESRLQHLLAEIQALRPDCAVQLVPKAIELPRAVPVLSGQAPFRSGTHAGTDFQVVVFYSRGRPIENGGKDRPSLISTHPMFNRIAVTR